MLNLLIRASLIAAGTFLFFAIAADVSAADPNLFGAGTEAEAKTKLGGTASRFFDFIMWVCMALGLIGAGSGLAMSNGFIGNPQKGQETMKSGLIVAVCGGAGLGIKSLIGWLVG